jgi:hypothetical protein
MTRNEGQHWANLDFKSNKASLVSVMLLLHQWLKVKLLKAKVNLLRRQK